MKIFVFFLILPFAAFAGLTAVSLGKPFDLLITGDPLIAIISISSAMILISFLFGLICNEYSWVDRLWSILPALYAWILAVRAWPDPRLIAGAALVTLWAARLTFNFARKGGYSGMEDYRWAEVRKFIGNEFLWQAFNFGFISTYQNALFVLFVLPLYMAYLFKGTPFGIIDIAASVFFLGFLVLETIADQQQWDFHAKKKNGTTDKRFLDEGLFGFSRHPNYFAEIMIWWCVYLFGAAATGKWIDWSVIGMVLLTLLFQGSTWLTEMLSMRKYPEYAEYRKRVSRIVPWFPKKASFSDETESGKV